MKFSTQTDSQSLIDESLGPVDFSIAEESYRPIIDQVDQALRNSSLNEIDQSNIKELKNWLKIIRSNIIKTYSDSSSDRCSEYLNELDEKIKTLDNATVNNEESSILLSLHQAQKPPQLSFQAISPRQEAKNLTLQETTVSLRDEIDSLNRKIDSLEAQQPVEQSPVIDSLEAQQPVEQSPVIVSSEAQQPVEQSPVIVSSEAQQPVEQSPVIDSLEVQQPVEQSPVIVSSSPTDSLTYSLITNKIGDFEQQKPKFLVSASLVVAHDTSDTSYQELLNQNNNTSKNIGCFSRLKSMSTKLCGEHFGR